MAMKGLANCSKALERVQKSRQFGISSSQTAKDGLKMPLNKLHVTAQQKYPVAAALPLPANIDPAETTRFSPQRARDISANAIITHHSNSSLQKPIDITLDNTSTDPHIESYDCFGAVNLNSSMQSNVPSPFGGLHKFTHLNMPGGQWGQDSKFMSHNLQSSHYTNLRRDARSDWSNYDENATQKKGMNIASSMITTSFLYQGRNIFVHNKKQFYNLHELSRRFSTDKKPTNTASVQEKGNDEKLSRKDKLKRAFKDYGATIIVFHVGISLTSLGLCYLAVSRGIDVVPLIESLGIGSSVISSQKAAGASTFVLAYCIHKIFAPVRISITLGCAPLIVRYLRNKGILKVK